MMSYSYLRARFHELKRANPGPCPQINLQGEREGLYGDSQETR